MLRRLLGSPAVIMTSLSTATASRLGFSNQDSETGYLGLLDSSVDLFKELQQYLSSTNLCRAALAEVTKAGTFVSNICSDDSVQAFASNATSSIQETISCLVKNLELLACQKKSENDYTALWWLGGCVILAVGGICGIRTLNNSKNKTQKSKAIELGEEDQGQYLPPADPSQLTSGLDLENVVVERVMARFDIPADIFLSGSQTNLQSLKPAKAYTSEAQPSAAPQPKKASVTSFGVYKEAKPGARQPVVSSITKQNS